MVPSTSDARPESILDVVFENETNDENGINKGERDEKIYKSLCRYNSFLLFRCAL